MATESAMPANSRRAFAALLALLLAAGPLSAHADPPVGLTYQGVLTRADGSLVADGTYSVRFSIWSQATGGTQLFVSAAPIQVSTVAGLYNVVVTGSTLTSLFDAAGAKYIQIEVLSGPGFPSPVTLLPRQQIQSVPYSFASGTAVNAQHATSADHAATADALTNPVSGGPIGAWREIHQQSVTSPVASLTIPNLTGAGSRIYRIIFRGRVTAAGSNREMYLRVNDASTANYFSYRVENTTGDTKNIGLFLGDTEGNNDADVLIEYTLSITPGAFVLGQGLSSFVVANNNIRSFRIHGQWFNAATPVTALWLGFGTTGATFTGEITILELGG